MCHFELNAWLAIQRQRIEALLDERSYKLGGPTSLVESMRYSLQGGGKRLRPILCLAFAEAAAGTSSGGGCVADDAACALEYVHAYSLIHDDLPAMDNDDLRRGRPTNHKVFGEAMAILAGDALLTEAFGLVANGQPGEEMVRSALVQHLAMAAGAAGMVGGQVLDVADDRLAQLDYLVQMHRMKTGALISASCQMGVIAARGPSAMVASAKQYGDAVGLAFQIADDVLDVTSSQNVLGKPTGADAAADRATFPALLGIERSMAMARNEVEKAISAVRSLEPHDGPLAALARYCLERSI